jgi:hypothetical protein
VAVVMISISWIFFSRLAPLSEGHSIVYFTDL